MSREILFRAKRTDNKEWVEGYYQEHPKGYVHIQNSYNDCFSVLPKTVCQYTEKNDKEGNKIWDGSILETSYDDKHPEDKTISKVFWNDGEWALREKHSPDFSKLEKFDCERSVVVGNIFDNFELIN